MSWIILYRYRKYLWVQIKECTVYLNTVNLVSLFIFICTLTNSWASIFLINWICGMVALFGSFYLGSQGILTLFCSATLLLLIKSIKMLHTVLLLKARMFISLGSLGFLSNKYILYFNLQLDLYNLSFILLTLTIGFFALVFSFSYMRSEPRLLMFLYLLFFFLISMVLLLSSGNFETLLLGWELIGCYSFLLISFWFTRVGTFKSSFKAFTFNKLSDVCLLLCFIINANYLPNVIGTSFNSIYLLNTVYINILGVSYCLGSVFIGSLVVCSFCKSAQFGFHLWLPDSMEAPVPASALIHSATLVSAGIFLLGRSPVITLAPTFSLLILFWGSFTALYGGVVASYQTDLKKILAYSTISHCGFMFTLIIFQDLFTLIIYLHFHGWFKSYSFMLVGSIISKNNNYQDYRRCGGSVSVYGASSIVLMISLCGLGGLPFLVGFFNKHFLLLNTFQLTTYSSIVLLFSSAFTGLFYTQKTIKYLYSGPVKSALTTYSSLQGGYGSQRQTVDSYSFLLLILFYSIIISIFSFSVLYLTMSWVKVTDSNFTYISYLFFFIYFSLLVSFHKTQYTLLLILTYLGIKILYVIW